MARRRGQALDDALLDAAWVVLQRVGYQALSMEAVAAEAATSKNVLYRRWPSRPELVLAAVYHRAPPSPSDPPDTGSLRGDLRAYLAFMSDRLADVVDAASSLLADFPGNPQLLDTVRRSAFGTPIDIVADILQPIVDRAAARGEIPTASLPARTLTAPLDVARFQLIMSARPLDDLQLDAFVDDVALPLYGA
ncbi:TetR/AcrR family transcriptional regulator [uncultured Jatrophihabitans sp.]|uniref:TetR/AcrR family transcriptional regulator n=1 Tax=uncultured Jatrophihabitans sp. TaxID=1610747 RepID=UPI0035CA4A9C